MYLDFRVSDAFSRFVVKMMVELLERGRVSLDYLCFLCQVWDAEVRVGDIEFMGRSLADLLKKPFCTFLYDGGCGQLFVRVLFKLFLDLSA